MKKEGSVAPSIFVGSSREGLDPARAVEFQLKDDAEVTLWNEGVFGLSHGTLESLVNALERFDFAALILTPDDVVSSREISTLAPRDNVMFELSLFIGHLGRSRTFVVCPKAPLMKLPTDLAGVTVAQYDSNRSDENLIAALGPACTLIRQSIRDLGRSEARGLQRLHEATSDFEGVSDRVGRLVHLLARSRILELDVITKQFAGLLPTEFLEKVRADLEELEDATSRNEDDT